MVRRGASPCCPSGTLGRSRLQRALNPPISMPSNCATGYRVLFTRTTDLVQRLQVARRELALESLLARLDRYNLLILDDLAYVRKDQAETSVLFELISARYERRSLHNHGQPALRRLEQGVPRLNHCGGCRRPPPPTRHDPRDERRGLSPTRRPRQAADSGSFATGGRRGLGGPPGSPPRRTPPRTDTRSGAAMAALTRASCGPPGSHPAGRALLRRRSRSHKAISHPPAEPALRDNLCVCVALRQSKTEGPCNPRPRP